MKPITSYVQNYQILGQLGDGGQAIVYLAKKDQQLYAVKVYKSGTSGLTAYQRQVKFLSQMKHKYLISLIDYKADGKIKMRQNQEQILPIIVIQYSQGGDLYEIIQTNGGFKGQFLRRIFKQLIQLIQFLFQKGISHRDIKPQNILFDKNYDIKVTDFGLATDEDGTLNTRLGTPGYKSPEMEKGQYKGVQSDLFGAGVTLFVMYNGSQPFTCTKTTDKLYKYIRQKNFNKFWNLHEKKKGQGFFQQSFKKLMNSFFSQQIEKRPTFQSLKEDKWLNQKMCSLQEFKIQMTSRTKNLVLQNQNKQKLQQIKCNLKKQQQTQHTQNKLNN